ncbi:MAG TPA: hydrogenase, partial [Candidatus Sumerlaeota bacterium]|nr:hydrogenase [Candidatus Sumerlaeota bacterium]
FWALILCNVAAIQFLWLGRVRRGPLALFLISIVINIGMWLERFVIVITSLHRDYLPSAWGDYNATRWDWATFLGTLGFFLACMFLFIRFVPLLSIYELREMVHARAEHGGNA